jgi:hypothetical protein
MINCKKLTKQTCIANAKDCIWETGKGCRNIVSSTVSNSATTGLILNPSTNRYVKITGKIGQSILRASQGNSVLPVATAAAKASSSSRSSTSSSNRSSSTIKVATSPKRRSTSSRSTSSSPMAKTNPPKRSSSSPRAAKHNSPRKSPSPDKLQSLQKQMNEARKNRDIKKIIELNKLIQEEVQRRNNKNKSIDDIPDFLHLLPFKMSDFYILYSLYFLILFFLI